MRLSIFIVVTGGFLWMACNDAAQNKTTDRKDGFSETPATKEDSLYHDVMEGHDVGMAKMGKLRGYLKQVQQALDSVNKLPRAQQDEQYQQKLMDVQEDLNYAEYSMNTWMEEFKIDSGKGNPAVRLRYLEAEKVKVTKVKENILGSLSRADSLLGK
jgi:hypothetical protein